MTVDREDEILDMLLEQSVKMFDSGDEMTAIEMAMSLMDFPEVLMHCPLHHFIVPAVLLTACMKADGRSRSRLIESLSEAKKRSKNVLGGFCGYYGACGSAVGVGIFMSIWTDTTPLSVSTWSWTNRATGLCLTEISVIPGPRCCKRTTFIALETAVPLIREWLGIELPEEKAIVCRYSDRNAECKKNLCLYYARKEKGEMRP